MHKVSILDNIEEEQQSDTISGKDDFVKFEK